MIRHIDLKSWPTGLFLYQTRLSAIVGHFLVLCMQIKLTRRTESLFVMMRMPHWVFLSFQQTITHELALSVCLFAGALNNHSFEGFYTRPNKLVLLWLMGPTVYRCNPFCPSIQTCSRSRSACNFILRFSRRWLSLSNCGFLSTKARSLSAQSAAGAKLTHHFVALYKTGVIFGLQHWWKRHRYKWTLLTWPNWNCIAIM
jgi:hypothetical protein